MNVFELKILNFIQDNFKCGFLDWFMPKITLLGEDGIFWIAVAVILLIPKKCRKVGIMMGVALLLGFLIGNMTLKPLIGRVRPYDMPGVDIDLLVGHLGDKSFPSGHTLACFEAATVLMLNDKRFGIPALIGAILVGLSRIYLYVHYPTDVLAGAVLGIAFGVLGCYIVNWAAAGLSKKKRQIN
ncbi:MAG: phosphatase PAP2 family protein [Clostridia bacterium]|nr:phosphatase PAP2 family protein [Clostridia bacterium]